MLRDTLLSNWKYPVCLRNAYSITVVLAYRGAPPFLFADLGEVVLLLDFVFYRNTQYYSSVLPSERKTQ
jgi:hypothetical protein